MYWFIGIFLLEVIGCVVLSIVHILAFKKSESEMNAIDLNKAY